MIKARLLPAVIGSQVIINTDRVINDFLTTVPAASLAVGKLAPKALLYHCGHPFPQFRGMYFFQDAGGEGQLLQESGLFLRNAP